ncbi:MAG: hypothetical protein AMJ46_03605 [Latescibacteria bacterium DG_63]|nr:MAG: hypothetical protein AMJ46_03605 [Latescibacteria bacterium DG_63]
MENNTSLTREKITQTLVDALRPLDFVNALWEGGAIAFGRLDEWSDIDICVDSDDGKVKEVFPVAERALETLAPIELRYEVPLPSSHHYSQMFYRLKGTSEFLLIDFAVFKHSAKDKLLEPEIHGRARFHFNKNDSVKLPCLDQRKLMDEMKTRIGKIQERYDMFKCFFSKQMSRGNYIEALDLYGRLLLAPLVELLRMRHSPARHSFKTYYVHYDLPAEVVERLRQLYFVRDERDLEEKYRLAERWLRETMRALDFEEIQRRLGSI